MTDFFLSLRPAYPWSVAPVGLPALAVVAALLVALTLWTYTGHPNATRRRILILVGLRMLALLVALLTALRPSVGVQEHPKVPSVLLIGVDTSESMNHKDEVNNQSRIDAVKRVLDKAKPTLDELTEQGVTVVMYKFSTPDFSEAVNRYTPGDPADGKRSDYGTYLNRTFQRWQSEKFVRGHLIIGDGIDNGEAYSAVAEAGAWGRRQWPITTFLVGEEGSGSTATDIYVTGVEAEPSPAPIKTEVTVTGTVHAYGFTGQPVVARVFIGDKVAATETFTLDKERDNKLRVTVKVPAERGEYKVRMVVGRDDGTNVVPLLGEHNPDNNQSETYLTVTKDGVRLLIIDRLRWEETRLRDALRSEKRFDVNEVIRQTNRPPSVTEQEFLDLDAQAYDVIIIGNISADQLVFTKADGTVVNVLEKIRERVLKHGTGVMFLGGEQAFRGVPDDLLPVKVTPGEIVEKVEPGSGRPIDYYQTVPTENGLAKMMKMAKEQKDSITVWDELNAPRRRYKITGYNKMTAKPVASVYAWAEPTDGTITAGTRQPPNRDPLLVGFQIGDGARGRVLALAAYDTYLWEKHGQPKTRQGTEIHTRFWKQCVLWLAHQDEEEGQAYVRPSQRQLKTNGEQTLRVGVKSASGGDDPNAELTVKIVPLPEGKAEPDPAEIAKARAETVVRDATGAKVLYRPKVKGEYFVVLTSPKKDAAGKPVLDPEGKPTFHRATAKFIAVPDISDELLRVGADASFLERLSVPTGGKALRLEDLPGFLKEMKEQKPDETKAKPRYYPDWRRKESKVFLPLWVVVFALLLGAEWGLRRLWGMV